MTTVYVHQFSLHEFYWSKQDRGMYRVAYRQLRKILAVRHPSLLQSGINESLEFFKDDPVWKSLEGKRYGHLLLPVPRGFKDDVIEIEDEVEEEEA